jgi:hypothetical protein
MMTVEEIRAASALFYAAGADGIYSFNYFCSRAAGQEPDFSVFDEIGNPDSLTRLEKLYALAVPKYPIPNVSLPAALPLELTRGESREVLMQTAEHQAPHSALLRIECRDSVSTAALQVSFNGARLSGGSHPSREFVRKVPYKPTPAPRCLEFIIDPGVIRRNNTLTLTAREGMTVEWIYLAVKP